MIENWQEWVVMAILIGCLIYLLLKIKTFFRKAKNNERPCGSCASNCELKHQVKSSIHSSRHSSECENKKCCG